MLDENRGFLGLSFFPILVSVSEFDRDAQLVDSLIRTAAHRRSHFLLLLFFLSCLLMRRSLRSLSSRAVEKSCVSQCAVSSGGPVSQSSMTALDSAGLDQPRDVGIY